MGKYEILDGMILLVLSDKVPKTFSEIHHSSPGLHAECENLSAEKNMGFRVLDRRLQSLRKAGKIVNVSSSKGWIRLNAGGRNR